MFFLTAYLAHKSNFTYPLPPNSAKSEFDLSARALYWELTSLRNPMPLWPEKQSLNFKWTNQQRSQVMPLTVGKASPNRKSSYRSRASSACVRAQNFDDFFRRSTIARIVSRKCSRLRRAGSLSNYFAGVHADLMEL